MLRGSVTSAKRKVHPRPEKVTTENYFTWVVVDQQASGKMNLVSLELQELDDQTSLEKGETQAFQHWLESAVLPGPGKSKKSHDVWTVAEVKPA
jgi:hypothetical protein